ncbi:MAG: methyltransferase domain-containing protein [Zavarzinella sp.]|nr:methyltransferase domain-containing protein [Zavarzinella sp.]
MKRQDATMAGSHQLVDAVREHYDRLSGYYDTFWGEHIHHGYWEADETPAAAQVNLVARLAERAGVPRGARVLDVGCGLGGSALWLARHLGCTVTGITISPVQVQMATDRARAQNLGDRVRFLVVDANRLDLAPESFDVVWVIECSEHIDDKAGLLAACARVLGPGGRLALCAWLAADDRTPERDQLVAEVCEGMLCPSLSTRSDYTRWMEAAGLDVIEAEDVTVRVQRTWTHCAATAERPEVKGLLKLTDGRTRAFVHSFGAIHRAYAAGAMAYGMFTARKP